MVFTVNSIKKMIMGLISPKNLSGPITIAKVASASAKSGLESYISFLGYGIQAPLSSWGNMLTNAQDYFIRAPIMVVWPGLILILMVLSASFLGDGLRDVLDPRTETTR